MELNDAPCGFVSFGDDGTMLFVNRTLAEMLGYARVELEGWHLQKILPPGARVFYNTHLFPMLRMHGKADEIFLALQTKDGREIPVLLNAVRRERDDRFVNDCVVVRLLQRAQYEQQLLEARREAEQASAAKDRFLSMMSHDLRTPLTAISGNAQFLAKGFHGELNAEQQEDVGNIQAAAREVARMIDDILAFAQLETGRVRVEPRPVPVDAAITRAESLIRVHLAQSHLSFDSSACDDLTVHADPDRLQQILLNLLTNAIKFTPPGGRITVSCERAGDRALLRVRDTGIGIAHDQLERIFDAFVQLGGESPHTTQRGVGLGLAISRELARAMGGELTADSTPGEGSVFTLELPAAETTASSWRR